ncbi:hyphally regulated cell wall protein 3 isoform X2 [Anopheles stephensi]|uniref:hyphally regulated cell wall protein 3 isoform X2 n=1 Tax=Anopheles stephensi TaxID=30069 RepID=UPI00165881C2|nr:hyphally regulated cell wall protein 3 isoform X2 [Anopheles stephensi]
MISVKRPSVSSHPSAHHHHHHHHQPHHHHHHHKQHHQLHSLQNGASSAGSVTSASLVTTTSANNNRLIRSRNQLSTGSEQQQDGKHQPQTHWNPQAGGGGFVSNGGLGIGTFGGVAGGQVNRPTGAASWTGTGSGCSIITNGGSLYYSSSNGGYGVSTATVNPKIRDIYEFDSLFLLPACALTSDKALNLRKDLAAYDFDIKILEDSPRGSHNVWQSGNRDATVQKQSRPSSANRDRLHEQSVAHTLHWFACVGEDSVDNGRNAEELQKEREERIKQMKERQNEERQKKLEELKAQALAAQKFREQKEEERRRRMDDLRRRESDRRSQVEERRRAIVEADNERREYILRKNQEREQRMETKRRNDRGSIQFAFGSSTPRMIDTSDSGMCSSFWAHRRATSITNVAYTGAALTRRSSERELTDSASKKRATSASGLDRSTDDQRRMSSSMYEVFNWTSTSECPRKLTFSLAAGPGINIDDPPTAAEYQPAAARNYASGKEMNYQRTVNRRKTDLMPTIPSPRDSSRSSLGTHTPRTPGRAFSMTRLDQLAQPRRRNGEHISAILERERRQALELENLTRLSLSSSRSSPTGSGGNSKRMSRSMSQLAGSGAKYRNQSQDSNSGRSPGFGGGRKSSFHSSSMNSGSTSPMRRNDTSKSMSQLNTVGGTARITKTERLRQQYHHQQQQQLQSQLLVTNGLRSGEMTPTSLNTSRPGSAMSSSTTASGIVYRRTLPAQRKPRPASIAVTGVTASGLKEDKPPLPKTGSGASTGSGVTSASSKHRLSSAGSGSINTTPAKSASGMETPTKKPLSIHSAEKRSASVRGSTPKASSTPLQSPGPEKASRSLQDSLKKAADGGGKKAPASSEKPATTKTATVPKEEVVAVEAKPDAPAAPKAEEQVVEPEKVVVRDESSQQASLVEVDQSSFGQEEQPQQQQEEVVVPVQQEAPAPALPTESSEVPQQVEVAPVKVVPTPVVEQVVAEPQDVSEPKMLPEEETVEVINGGLTVDVAGGAADAMTASMIAKRITTEEEAKAALAERRRLAREEAERQAELERKRIEAEEQAERQRVLEEEERLRKLEEETIRLAEEQRRMEEERLQQAIEEARRRDEEERKRREEEARQKAEREEAERKAREEAERQRVEMAERLKKEEKEREERRKRVEAIMSRTRAKGTANSTPTKNNEDDKENAMSKSQIVLSSTPAALPTGTAMSASTISMTDSFIASEIRQEQAQQQQQQQQQHQSLEQAMESLSLSNNNNNNGNSSNSSSSSETLAHSSTINNTINNNNNNNGGSNIQFEKSVAEKESLLLLASSTAAGVTLVANNNLNNGSTSNGTGGAVVGSEATNGDSIVPTTNGKTEQQSPAMMASSNGSSATANSTSDLIIEDALMGQTNGHKNGTMDNVFAVNDTLKPQTTGPMGLNDFHIPTNGDHHRHRDDSRLPSLADPNAEPSAEQQHSSFESSGTASTVVTTETTIVSADDAAANSCSNADPLIDFASFSTSEVSQPGLVELAGAGSDANFNPLAPLDVHNNDNNNSINPFFSSNYDGDAASGDHRATEAILFDLTLDNTSNGGGTTNTSSSPFFTNNNNNTNTSPPNNNNNNSTPSSWLVSATSDGQENRDLSLL